MAHMWSIFPRFSRNSDPLRDCHLDRWSTEYSIDPETLANLVQSAQSGNLFGEVSAVPMLVGCRSNLLLSPFAHAMRIASLTIAKRLFLPSMLCLTLASFAQINDAVRALKLLPAPKEVRM